MMAEKGGRGMLKSWAKRIGLGVLIVSGAALVMHAAHRIPALIARTIIVPILLCMGANAATRIGPAHYQYTYAMIDEWNKSATNERADIFGYGEYLYNSHMILFPREKPGTLSEYYFYWAQSIDVDYYGVYFTCQMNASGYAGFAEGMANFAMTTTDGTISPVFDTEHFEYPTYILQWLDEGEKWEVLEYVMLDEERYTAVFVYTMGALDEIEEISSYTVTPKTMDILPDEQKGTGFSFDLPGIQQYFSGFSIYDGFENATCDLSFLDYLK